MDRGSAGRAWAAVVGSFMEGSSARAGVAGALPGQGGGRAVEQGQGPAFLIVHPGLDDGRAVLA
jgi:hypothetical protein